MILERNIFQKDISNQFTGRLLFKALISNILDEIYSKRGFRIKDLDMAIVQGKSTEELFLYIRLLASSIKYLTILSEDNESIEKQVEDFYEETGLSMRVTHDCRSGFKGVNFILNLGDLLPSMKLSSQAVVLNYGDSSCNRAFGENIIINGIEVKLPSEMAAKLGKNVLDYYTQLELAEMMLYKKVDIHIEDVSIDTAEKISKEFTKRAFSISGFVGRRNVLKTRDIKVCTDEDSA